ncbi:MAG: FHA domain-containing protein, partial [Kiritimatiellae bacterium]|nr:FHA domain-containing protein [Kiritimatiellia bacterium]
MSDQCELLIVNGSLAGRRFAVPKGGLRLGRASTSDVAIPDEELSRSHAMFERNAAGELTVLDLASANGTLVNGENIGLEVRTLRSGDRIEVGATLIQVVPEGFVGQPPPVEKVEKVEKTEVEKPPAVAERVDLGLGGAPATGADAPAAADAGP